MKEDFKETIRILWGVHRGKLCGTFLGLLIGAGIVCFGFWKTFFVFCCGAVGLFVGTQFDRGEFVAGSLADRISDLINRFQR